MKPAKQLDQRKQTESSTMNLPLEISQDSLTPSTKVEKGKSQIELTVTES